MRWRGVRWFCAVVALSLRSARFVLIGEGRIDVSEAPVSLRLIGAQVKALRQRAGLTQAELGKKVGYSESQIRSIEAGRRTPKPDLLVRFEELFKVPGVFTSVADELLKEPHPSWFQPFAVLEAEAVGLSAYDNQLVNGLLQTEAYARAVHIEHRPALDDQEIELRVDARLARQKLLTRVPAASLSFIFEEVLLRRSVGGREVMREQLERLLDVAQMRHVEIQVMPTERPGHAGLEGPLTVVEPPEKELCAYLEVQNIGRLITDRPTVSKIAQRYAILRSQALTPDESVSFIKQLATGAT
ncbi:helix-turn-helix domain-containing protein [Streptantibioticus ferralitis]|uniref:Helix-turn-helix transcriptional regulator n=1 Tax=Streptantibioticus ferralitis TaxID=236510 RepID=A0ABT5Z257_9ACTN|nr:helix-turn-helix transcriptional regulator [Streptantibioticus ferralitis]MDF2257902.1 helix-turn-helix transcriptional regulator [Streptantibioticus ferralitis]